MSVSLNKGQSVSLVKSGVGTLSGVRMGCGWDAIAKKGMFGKSREVSVDLDASVVLLDADKRLMDQVWFQQLKSKDGSVRHTGDNTTGKGDGDDESILVDLTAVPANVHHLVFVVNSFSGQDFGQIENAFCRLVDTTQGDAELARYDISGSGNHTAVVMARVTRDGDGWSMTAIGAPGAGRTFRDIMPLVNASI